MELIILAVFGLLALTSKKAEASTVAQTSATEKTETKTDTKISTSNAQTSTSVAQTQQSSQTSDIISKVSNSNLVKTGISQLVEPIKTELSSLTGDLINEYKSNLLDYGTDLLKNNLSSSVADIVSNVSSTVPVASTAINTVKNIVNFSAGIAGLIEGYDQDAHRIYAYDWFCDELKAITGKEYFTRIRPTINSFRDKAQELLYINNKGEIKKPTSSYDYEMTVTLLNNIAKNYTTNKFYSWSELYKLIYSGKYPKAEEKLPSVEAIANLMCHFHYNICMEFVDENPPHLFNPFVRPYTAPVATGNYLFDDSGKVYQYTNNTGSKKIVEGVKYIYKEKRLEFTDQNLIPIIKDAINNNKVRIY